jgi:hypothetical protein
MRRGGVVRTAGEAAVGRMPACEVRAAGNVSAAAEMGATATTGVAATETTVLGVSQGRRSRYSDAEH